MGHNQNATRFQVLLLNDDYTTMEFVIQVLQQFFDKTEESAYAIMLKTMSGC
jgi:ATP-dependent Clp protease adaptor protein ClpS